MNKSVLRFKVTLRDVSPSVWRRFELPSESTFFDLHCAIQDSMGWTDSHLHGFTVADPNDPSRPLRFSIPSDDLDLHPDRDERVEHVGDWVKAGAPSITYEYDFGDSWTHLVEFERLAPVEPGVSYPRLLDGAGACPLEDRGGGKGLAWPH